MQLDGAFDTYCAERLDAAQALLLGRSTFAMFTGFWPAVVDAPEATDAQRTISRRDNVIDKIVVSDTLRPEDTGPWRDTTLIVARGDGHAAVLDVKARTSGDVLVFGSRLVWNDLLAAGLVDEVHLVVGSTVLGGGTPAFGTATPHLDLLDVRTFDDSTNVVLRYAVIPAPHDAPAAEDLAGAAA